MFDMTDFAAQLEQRKDELEGEIFEMLLTFSDFLSFKEMFLDYRAMKEDKTVDLSAGLTVTPLRLDTAASATDSQQNRDGQSEKDSPS
ncbi:ARL2BP [Bugula neritina]|uniref:ADP-ribosylation factor-like protein 2-binding protein n=1 Tax=Bugula neritina TaxID=10212 RepID=A0A7J7JKA8_BUGNE|nr:ARL2BP [Bugula neritina]